MSSVADDVRSVIRRHVASARDQDLPDTLPLGGDGLGLDSVAIVELLLACEAACGVRLPPDVFEGAEVTVGAIVRAVEQASGARPPGAST